ncbi:MAG: PRC-barrel domain-containing protein [Candidatus Methanomethylophilaceae archaeon]|jgi:sporulation protein YlmC with PRC-barrel domain|nr:PRC-barrel domain-containing protein [Candidatus Methanomethylophilaceae archaeon]NCA74096.1 photosystem reaction center subunit H [Gammaproteobacteria bacterium]MDD2936231.1 PRC-barrel domain-containing protein [Candidatus Methanomethylophilaceae archaeon]MDD3986781.1 PRC-barrel domain-containing protein [Candidatus Methanomethylophilaceae archaeon]MDD4709592.1 PRC-barrel domain-containing protein [Candidatus Methanomethylophilaceae archaeon]
MLETLSDVIGLEIYEPRGMFVGTVDEVVIDISAMRATGLYVEQANPVLVDEDVAISIPFGWVRGIGDAVILRTFPEHVGAEGGPPQDAPLSFQR